MIESMNEKLQDLDNVEQLQAELDWAKKQRGIDEQKMAELRNAITQVGGSLVTVVTVVTIVTLVTRPQ